jgi:integrase
VGREACRYPGWQQARALLAACEGERLGARYVLALTTGMGRGELLDLRWTDVDLVVGVLAVRSTLYRAEGRLVLAEPKTARSRRLIHLTPDAVAAFRAHRYHQLQERLQLGPAWDAHDLVFANELGRPVQAQNMIRRSFYPLLGQAGVPRIRFHDLRHSTANLLLTGGVHPKVVSEILGHATVGITLNVYSHVLPAMHREAVGAMSLLLAPRPSGPDDADAESGGRRREPPRCLAAQRWSERWSTLRPPVGAVRETPGPAWCRGSGSN